MEKKPRKFAHPRSFIRLAITGFAFVTLPLIVSLITGAYFVDKLTRQSQEAVYRAVQATQTGRVLLEQIGAMERVARQYFILRDDSLFRNYIDRHELYIQSADQLSILLNGTLLHERLILLNELELDLFKRVRLEPAEPTNPHVDEAELIALTDLAQALLRDSGEVIDSEMAAMKEVSEQARTVIFVELLMVIPVSIFFISIFVFLLSRPIRQIDIAIKQLGAGDFSQAINVSGPNDVQYIGKRLDWLRARLKYLEEKKSKFLQYVSHELKTPLTAVREGADLLSEGVMGRLTEEQHEVTQILKNNSINLQKMIEKLLSFNMPDQANAGANITEVYLPRVIETVVADHKPVILAKQIDLQLAVDAVSIFADEEQLRVIIDNLLSNAVKHTPKYGKVRLVLHRKIRDVIIDVIDSGLGVAKHEAEKVFDPYYQGETAEIEGVIRGSGLGLSIVKEFVEAHNGKIEVIENKSSSGAHFRVLLPLLIIEKDLEWDMQ